MKIKNLFRIPTTCTQFVIILRKIKLGKIVTLLFIIKGERKVVVQIDHLNNH